MKCCAGWESKGQPGGWRRRRKHRKERVKRATEERSERAPSSRLGLRWSCRSLGNNQKHYRIFALPDGSDLDRPKHLTRRRQHGSA
ncbi:hypothetical protein BN903_297 [Halorubrum sp. AJ67]|nr:hypothetical protein BN903_297 [Halorubrum sp. AJ67]